MTELDNLIGQVNLVVDSPSLNDTARELERFNKSLFPFLDNRTLQTSLASLRDLGPVLRRGKWQV